MGNKILTSDEIDMQEINISGIIMDMITRDQIQFEDNDLEIIEIYRCGSENSFRIGFADGTSAKVTVNFSD